MAEQIDFKVKNGLVVATTATILSNTPSISTNTGALIVAGGVGIGGQLYVGNSATIEASVDTRLFIVTRTTATGSGAGFDIKNADSTWGWRFTAQSDLFKVRDHKNLLDKLVIQATSSGNAYLYNFENFGIGDTNPTSKLSVNGTANISGITTITNTTNASSTITGALVVAGGVGVGGDIWAGNNVSASGFIQTPYSIVQQEYEYINRGTGHLTRTFDDISLSNFPHRALVHQTGKFLFVGCDYSNTIAAYSINTFTGNLTSIESYGTVVKNFDILPNGDYLYAAASANVNIFSINKSSGVLTSAGSISTSTSNGIAIHPTGNYLYLTNGFNTSLINAYQVNQTTGALTLIQNAVSVGANYAMNPVVDPSGRFLYVCCYSSALLKHFSINQSNGQLTLSSTTALVGGDSPNYVVVHPSGKFLYVGCGNTNLIKLYSLNFTTGTPTYIQQYSGSGASYLLIDPKGENLYATGGTTGLSCFYIEPNTGLLTALENFTLSLIPSESAIDPSGRFLYVTQGNSNKIALFARNNFSAGSGFFAGNLSINSTASSISTNTGALTVAGGVGIGGNLYIGGEIVAQKLTIQLTTVTTTLIQTDDIIQTSNTTNATSTTTGALVVSGGAGIGQDLRVGGTIYGNISGTLTGNAGTVSTVQQTSNASYYLTFVDANNATATAESIYTTSSFVINPSTGNIGIGTNNPAWKLHVVTATQGTDGIYLYNGNQYAAFRPNMSSGANNGITQAGDSGIIFTTGTTESGAFIIAPWSTGTSGLRITAAGTVGIGGSPPVGQTFRVAKNITGATNSYGIVSQATILSDVTSAAYMYSSYPSTQAASWTLGSLRHYDASQGSISSTVTNQIGFYADSSLTSATNNYGFFSNIPYGSGRWNFYAAGSGENYVSNRWLIGRTYSNGEALGIYFNSGVANSSGVYNDTTISSATTSSFAAFSTYPGTAAASFTLPFLYHYRANQNTIGANSTVTNQYGFVAEGNLIGATNNYGFFSAIAGGTNRFNFYASGTATNYFAGNVGIGITSPNYKLDVFGSIGLTSSGPHSRLALTNSNWGYSTSYRALVIGSTSTVYNTAVTGAISLAFNYDPVINTASTFNGDGRELIFRRGTRFVTPNAANTAWNLQNLVLYDGNVGIGTDTPTYKLDVDGQVRLGQNVTQIAPSATDILSTAHVMLGGNGGNYLTIGQYPAGQSFAQWIQSSYINPTTAVYNLILQPLGGNVGIATATPQSKLHVSGTVAYGSIRISPTSANGESAIAFFTDTAGTDTNDAWVVGHAGWGNTGDFVIGNENNGAGGSVRLLIEKAGNVGINTTTPAYTLEVNGSFAATTKSFVINHPTKPGMKLRYGSLEGPENGVYVRGKLTGTNVIELPEYWIKLVDPDSITVNLTPIGRHQNLYVENIADNKVTISNSNLLNKEINCFYIVYGERRDVDKLQVEVF